MKVINVICMVMVSVFIAGSVWAGGAPEFVETDPVANPRIDAMEAKRADMNVAIGHNEQDIAYLQNEVNTLKEENYNPYYVALRGALSMPSDSDVAGYNNALSYNPSYGFFAAAGREFDAWLFEGEIGYQRADFDEAFDKYDVKGHANVMTFMANGYYTYDITPAFGMYGMAGVGLVNFNVDSPYTSDQSNAFGMQFGLGAEYDINNQWTVDAGWRYLTTSNFDIENENMSYTTNMFIVGARYSF